MFDNIRRFFISADFYKSLTFIIGALVPIIVTDIFYNNVTLGFAMALGVLYNSTSNIAGSVKHRTVSMACSIVLSSMSTLIMGYSSFSLWTLLPTLGILTFFISLISVYGFRASMVSLGVMLSVVISFGNSYVDVSVLEYALLIAGGGVWYLLLSSLFNSLNPQMYVEELLSDTLGQTGKYLNIRAKLLTEINTREALLKDLFELQAKLAENHEKLREVILTKRKKTGFSNRIHRRLLIFIELVDMLELAIANPVDYDKLDVIFKNDSTKISPFVTLIFEMSNQLDYLSKVVIRGEKAKGKSEIRVLVNDIRKSVEALKLQMITDSDKENYLILLNLFEYQESQVRKIGAIERVLNTYDKNNRLVKVKGDEQHFLPVHDYHINKLKENFSFKSSIFRHSMRLGIAMVLGFLVGDLLSFQNPYWILMTLLVIMRPTYGLTKQRMIHRVVGTVIGAVLALLMVFVIQNTIVFAVLAAVCLVLALALVQQNYKTFAVFLTLHIVFLSAVYSDDVFHAIQYRVIDTLVGAGIAIISNLFLFPSWEFMNVDDSIKVALKNINIYLGEIDKKYHLKTPITTEFKLSRKNAFLEMGSLNAAFQRMTQEPKSKQKYFSEIYSIVVLINTFLSSLASLGAYIRSHKTFAVSKDVDILVQNITDKLRNAQELIENKELTSIHSADEVEKAKETLNNKFNELSNNYIKVKSETDLSIESKENLALEMQETKMVLEQLSYLYRLSFKIVQKIDYYQKLKN
jgi:uncharacterized membrane protein YccC